MAHVTEADYAAWLNVDIGAVGGVQATLDVVTDLVRAELRQALDLVVGDRVTVRPAGKRALLLPELPIWSVTLVEQRTSADDDWAELVEGTDWEADLAAGMIWRGGHGWPRFGWGLGCEVRVTYTHGWLDPTVDYGSVAVPSDCGPIPAGMRAVILRVAARAHGNPHGVRQETVGRWSASYGGENPGPYLSGDDRRVLSQWKAPGP